MDYRDRRCNKNFTRPSRVVIIKTSINHATRKQVNQMPGAADIIKDSVIEFSRLQNWMLSVKDKDRATYNSMHERYLELKVTLTSLGVNLTELDKIKE